VLRWQGLGLRSASFVTGIIELTRCAGTSAWLVKVIDERNASVLASWMTQRELGGRAAVRVLIPQVAYVFRGPTFGE
jgi:hypothetical protein